MNSELSTGTFSSVFINSNSCSVRHILKYQKKKLLNAKLELYIRKLQKLQKTAKYYKNYKIINNKW